MASTRTKRKAIEEEKEKDNLNASIEEITFNILKLQSDTSEKFNKVLNEQDEMKDMTRLQIGANTREIMELKEEVKILTQTVQKTVQLLLKLLI